MARCGCQTFPTCSCVIVGDGLTTTVYGNGAQPSPYLVSVIGYPKPRPQGYVWQTGVSLTSGVDATISFINNNSLPTTMWLPGTPTRLLIPTTGTYIVDAGTVHGLNTDGFNSSDSGTRRSKLQIIKNGTTLLTTRHNGWKMPAIPIGDGSFHITSVVRLTAGDYIELIVNLASMVDALTTPVINTAFLGARWMGL